MAEWGLTSLKHMKVLFADDDIYTTESMCQILGLYFGEVLAAADGVQAWRLFQETAPDVVLLDIDMPGIDGLSLARQIRDQDADLPMAILTCHDDRELLLQAISLGLTDYLLKPIDPNALRQLLLRCFQQLELRGRVRYVFPEGASYYPTTEKAFNAEGEITLSKNERRFLQYLLARRGRLVQVEHICRHLADEAREELTIQGLRNLVHRLRRKLGKRAILSERDLGYQLP